MFNNFFSKIAPFIRYGIKMQ